jgi:hypothetical protein
MASHRGCVLFAVAMLVGTSTWGHGGGLDAAGCHQPKNGARHCHEKKQLGQATRVQCKAMPTDGWCSKYRKDK